jgi:hypothetical protein
MIRVRIGIASRIIGVSTKTLRRWNASGKLSCTRTVGGHRRVSMIEIQRLAGEAPGKGDEGEKETPGDAGTAVYCRVSSHEQKAKGDLARQVQVAIEHCTASGSREPVVTSIATRKGMFIELVNPRNTSKKCSACGTIGKRDGKTFHCTNDRCGLTLDSDLNAARNILVAPLSARATCSPGGCPLPPIPLTATMQD